MANVISYEVNSVWLLLNFYSISVVVAILISFIVIDWKLK